MYIFGRLWIATAATLAFHIVQLAAENGEHDGAPGDVDDDTDACLLAVSMSRDRVSQKIKESERSGDMQKEQPLITVEQLRSLAKAGSIAVAVVTYNRPVYLKKAMTSILSVHRDRERFPLLISQDGNDDATKELIQTHWEKTGLAFHMQHEKHKLQGPWAPISAHYWSIFRKVFDKFGFQAAIFLEDDLEVGVDFFTYFDAMYPVLLKDQKLFCISAWNDNGFAELVGSPQAVYRTEWFPGLGWMMQKNKWEELKQLSSRGDNFNWDDFLRSPNVRKEKQCIRPEISRTYTFGSRGVNLNPGSFKTWFDDIKLNNVDVDWNAQDLSNVSSVASFEKYLTSQIKASKLVDLIAVDSPEYAGQLLRVEYHNDADFKLMAEKFHLWTSGAYGIKRGSYRGVIPIVWKGRRVLIRNPQLL
eukprot:TRINITY_DN80323_c0_g1_i1.p1 TRINITY_DN80323_c0_g1~~TRINITY_DN80323_c0_g1_i1.p1  ORF type:complete len:417 (+),score=55.63 TRINITY_DN80323_c0_g1_i1:36-1286(+)